MKKLLFISNAPNHYQNEFYSNLSKFLRVRWFMYDKVIYKNNYTWNNSNKKIKIIYSYNQDISISLNSYNPDYIIIGYIKFLDYLKIIFYSIFKKKKIYFHKEFPEDKKNFLKKILRFIYYKLLFIKTDGIFCIGKKAQNYYFKFTKNSYYVPYSINPYKINLKNKIKKINFIFVGQLIDRKSILEIISAFKLLIKKFPKCKLSIIGTGKYKKTCLKNSKKIKQITFYDFREQKFIKKKLNESHVFLQPSKYDGWSVATMQAMNAGLAIIGTKSTNCISDYIKHLKNGYICDPTSQSIFKGMMFYCFNFNKLKDHMKKNKKIYDRSLMNSTRLSQKVIKIFSKN